jgi:protoporphyrinogen/coproporphyrinogen III oxidase
MPHIVVIGGGIAGLTTAYRLLHNQTVPTSVTLIEASERLGGKIRTGQVAGAAIDLGPEAFVARVPEVKALCHDLGLEEQLVAPATSRAYLWTRRRLRPFPEGLVSGVPTNPPAIIRSGILSLPGIARAGLDLLLPRGDMPADPTVTQVIGRRFGQEVVDRLVEPLLGGIHAGRADYLSLTSVAPHLAAAARKHRSFMLGLRSARPVGKGKAAPMLMSIAGGLSLLVERLKEELGDATIRTETHVQAITPLADGRYALRCDRGPEISADGVVLAIPASAAAAMLHEMAPELSTQLEAVSSASVVTITLAYPVSALPGPLEGSGFLVPRIEGRLLTACTWCTNKWPHLRDSGSIILRCSAGRWGDEQALHLTDDELVQRLHSELVEAMGLKAAPHESLVTRWEQAIPQYASGHQERIASIEAALTSWPGIVLTGAAYHGVGVSSCIRDSVRAATQIRTHLERAGRKQNVS